MFTSLAYFAAQMVKITALALMGLSFLISKPKDINARLFAIICLSSITYIVLTMQYHSNPEFRIDLSAYWLPMQIIMNTGAGCLMLLCYSLFQDSKKFPLPVLGIFGLQVLLSALRPLFVSNKLSEIDVESIGSVNYFVFGSLPILLQAMFVVIAGYWVFKGWQADVVESRRVLRGIFVASMLLLFLFGTVAELFVMNADPQQQIIINVYKTYGGAALVFMAALLSLRFEPFIDKVTHVINRNEELKPSAKPGADLDVFHRVFRDQKAYLEPGLSIADLAKKLAIPEYKLRHLVNKELGYRNFNALLNQYRIKDACEALSNPTKNKLPVLTIALSVGYQSIAPFNQAFRELKGLTPTQYRNQSQQAEFSDTQGPPPLIGS